MWYNCNRKEHKKKGDNNMFADEEKRTNTGLDEERNYYDSYFEEETKEVTAKKVTIAEPEEPKKFEFSLKNIVILTSLAAIILAVLASMFSSVGVYVVYAIFHWLGSFCLMGALGCYITQIIKNHTLTFEPQLVMLLLATFVVLV